MKTPKITKSKVDFILNKDATVRFVPMSDGEHFTACIYYKGLYDGRVQNMTYKHATMKDAKIIYAAYVEQELKRMSTPVDF